MIDEQARAELDEIDQLISRLTTAVEAQRAMKAKLHPERTMAKVLEFRPRSS